jgi:hypothetical protein
MSCTIKPNSVAARNKEFDFIHKLHTPGPPVAQRQTPSLNANDVAPL